MIHAGPVSHLKRFDSIISLLPPATLNAPSGPLYGSMLERPKPTRAIDPHPRLGVAQAHMIKAYTRLRLDIAS